MDTAYRFSAFVDNNYLQMKMLPYVIHVKRLNITNLETACSKHVLWSIWRLRFELTCCSLILYNYFKMSIGIIHLNDLFLFSLTEIVINCIIVNIEKHWIKYHHYHNKTKSTFSSYHSKDLSRLRAQWQYGLYKNQHTE